MKISSLQKLAQSASAAEQKQAEKSAKEATAKAVASIADGVICQLESAALAADSQWKRMSIVSKKINSALISGKNFPETKELSMVFGENTQFLLDAWASRRQLSAARTELLSLETERSQSLSGEEADFSQYFPLETSNEVISQLREIAMRDFSSLQEKISVQKDRVLLAEEKNSAKLKMALAVLKNALTRAEDEALASLDAFNKAKSYYTCRDANVIIEVKKINSVKK